MKKIIFCDGSSRGNPGRGGYGVVVKEENERVFELGSGEKMTTNNRMELMAAISALKTCTKVDDINIFTDSKYLVDGITKWVKNWKRNGWKKADKSDVLNKELWEELDSVTEGKKIEWVHVDGHAGVPGNERCDEIATSFADGIDVDLFDGPADSYHINLDIRKSSEILNSKNKNSKVFSYVSFVDGKFQRHTNWFDCEKVVKGKKNARFKKTYSEEDEKRIMEEWKNIK